MYHAEPYTIDDHRHRFAAWAASRAASVVGCRFTVKQGVKMLTESGLRVVLAGPDSLPTPDRIDAEHRVWRGSVIAAGETQSLKLSHGVAARLINVYLKAAFVCGGHADHERVCALHPPIDSLLLDGLVKNCACELKQEWKAAKKIRWSKFSSEEYETLIRHLRTAMKGKPMWMVEAHWRGYQ